MGGMWGMVGHFPRLAKPGGSWLFFLLQLLWLLLFLWHKGCIMHPSSQPHALHALLMPDPSPRSALPHKPEQQTLHEEAG